MELQEAIEFLKDYADWVRNLNRNFPDTMGIAIDTVLSELDRLKDENEGMDETYTKGYQEGYIAGSMEII